jgi:hypothetical protein
MKRMKRVMILTAAGGLAAGPVFGQVGSSEEHALTSRIWNLDAQVGPVSGEEMVSVEGEPEAPATPEQRLDELRRQQDQLARQIEQFEAELQS